MNNTSDIFTMNVILVRISIAVPNHHDPKKVEEERVYLFGLLLCNNPSVHWSVAHEG